MSCEALKSALGREVGGSLRGIAKVSEEVEIEGKVHHLKSMASQGLRRTQRKKAQSKQWDITSPIPGLGVKP